MSYISTQLNQKPFFTPLQDFINLPHPLVPWTCNIITLVLDTGAVYDLLYMLLNHLKWHSLNLYSIVAPIGFLLCVHFKFYHLL